MENEWNASHLLFKLLKLILFYCYKKIHIEYNARHECDFKYNDCYKRKGEHGTENI